MTAAGLLRLSQGVRSTCPWVPTTFCCGHGACRREGMAHEPFGALDQEQLDWISRFSDRLRLEDVGFADEGGSEQANEVARGAWERGEWRSASPEQAAQRWLAARPGH